MTAATKRLPNSLKAHKDTSILHVNCHNSVDAPHKNSSNCADGDTCLQWHTYSL